MKKLSFLITIAVAIILLSTCNKKSETPDENIEFGPTLVDTVSYHFAIFYTEVTKIGNKKIIQYGHCLSKNQNPDTTDEHTILRTLTAPITFTSTINDLEPNMTYYVRAYFINEGGIIFGEQSQLKTIQTIKPEVSTSAVTEITVNSAKSGGYIINNGGSAILENGICWSTDENPSLTNNIGFTNDSIGTDTFISSLTNLTNNTIYYVKAYAVNENGTAYGDAQQFKTVEIHLPTVETDKPSDITNTTVVAGGNVTDEGGGNVYNRGVCWNNEGNPTLENNTGEWLNGSGEGSFKCNVTGLNDKTTYYVAAFASNEAGTAYGQTEVFTTDETPFDISIFLGDFKCDETGYSIYNVNFTLDPDVENRIHNHNFWDWPGTGATVYYDFSGDDNRTIVIPEQPFTFGDGTTGSVDGTGTYNPNNQTFSCDYNVWYLGTNYPTHHEFYKESNGNIISVTNKINKPQFLKK